MFFYFLIFFFIVFLLLISPFVREQKQFLLFFIAVVLILIAGFRQIGVDNDSLTYVDIFNSVGSPGTYFSDYSQNSFYEPAYFLIPSIITNYIGLNVVWVFLIYAIIGVTLKFSAIYKLTDFALLSVLIYYSHFFLLHEVTQIRAGVASGFLLLSIIQIEKKNPRGFLGLIGAGFLFHYSIIVFLPFYFFSTKTLNKKAYLALLFVPFILHFLKFNIITILQTFKLGVFSEKIQLYNDLLELGVFNEINIFNTVFLVQLFICSILIIKSDLMYKNNKYALILLKIYCFAAASLVFFSNVPVFAIRISELLYVVQIILMPFLLYIIKPKYIALLLVILFALTIISINLLYVGILRPYFGNF